MFIMLLILSMIAAGCFVYFAMEGYLTASAIVFAAAVILSFTTAVIHFDNVAAGKVETLKSIGMEPLSNSQVYEMSRKELDKCKSIYTCNGIYYFRVEEK